jgi:hypothetical protein
MAGVASPGPGHVNTPMKRSQIVALALLLLLVAVGFWYVRSGRSSQVAVSLIDLYPAAFANEARTNVTPKEAAFRVEAISLAGETRQGIYMAPTSRLTFQRVAIPDNAWFRVWLGVKEEAWTQSTDGVLFRFGVSDGRTYDELLKQHVDPLHNTSDRRWIPVTVDLSAYAGQEVDLVFNTNSSLPGRGDDSRFDWSVWGAPEIFIQR